mmetsp:Transcript_18652/g.25983  ORF Transcript_18652/g.25983 Transcript_18652/m.25983 type:complete len:372 (-) Transcript_18652:228-1343(-)
MEVEAGDIVNVIRIAILLIQAAVIAIQALLSPQPRRICYVFGFSIMSSFTSFAINMSLMSSVTWSMKATELVKIFGRVIAAYSLCQCIKAVVEWRPDKRHAYWEFHNLPWYAYIMVEVVVALCIAFSQIKDAGDYVLASYIALLAIIQIPGFISICLQFNILSSLPETEAKENETRVVPMYNMAVQKGSGCRMLYLVLYTLFCLAVFTAVASETWTNEVSPRYQAEATAVIGMNFFYICFWWKPLFESHGESNESRRQTSIEAGRRDKTSTKSDRVENRTPPKENSHGGIQKEDRETIGDYVCNLCSNTVGIAITQDQAADSVHESKNVNIKSKKRCVICGGASREEAVKEHKQHMHALTDILKNGGILSG